MSQQWLMPENTCDVANVQPCTLLFGLDGRLWEQWWSSFMEIGGGGMVGGVVGGSGGGGGGRHCHHRCGW